jgi:hypothetical protein
MDQLMIPGTLASVPNPRPDGFFEGDAMIRAASWDDEQSSEVDDVSVFITATCTDAGRASRAVEAVVLELRRCATAFHAASAGTDQSPTSVEVLGALARDSSPSRTLPAGLDIVHVDGPPLRFCLRPRGGVLDVLASHPACAAGFTIGAFGREWELSLREDPVGQEGQRPSAEKWRRQRHRLKKYRVDAGCRVSLKVVRRYGASSDEIVVAAEAPPI